MARTKGSLNKSTLAKKNAGVYVMNFEKQIEGSPVTKKNSMGYVNYGAQNDIPNKLLGLYNESPTHAACINFGVQSIVAGGIDYEAMSLDGSQTVPNYEYSFDELIRNLALDFMLFGTYYLQIIKNNDDKTFSFWHIPAEKVRWSPYDEDGQIMTYWVNKPYIYCFRKYSPTMSYYTSPHYYPAIKAISAEIEYQNFDLKHIINGFSAAGILTLPECETDEQRQAIIDNVQRLFQGSSQANSIAITFRSNIEDKPVEWTPFSNKSNVDEYAGANQRVINRILAAHQINDPQLIGLPNLGGTGFNSEGRLLEVAYNVYNKVVGNYNRQCVIKTINDCFRMNGIDTEIIMKPLMFNDIDGENNAEDTKPNTDVDDKELTEEKVEEKVEK